MKVKAVWIPSVLVFGLVGLMGLVACGKKGEPMRLIHENVFVGSFPVHCGSNLIRMSYRITHPKDESKFASDPKKRVTLLMGGDSGTVYFGDKGVVAADQDVRFRNRKDPYQALVNGLIEKGQRVIEIKYPVAKKQCGSAGEVTGLYSACCAQGLDNFKRHNAEVYEKIVWLTGYRARNRDHQLSVYAQGSAAAQVQSMAYASGKRFYRVGLTGALFGNGVLGCQNGQANLTDGIAWTSYMNSLDSLTVTTRGCSQNAVGGIANLEFTPEHSNFANFQYKRKWGLGLFEGQNVAAVAPGEPGALPGQANAIEAERLNLQLAHRTVKTLYLNCGSELLYCTQGQALQDILNYLSN